MQAKVISAFSMGGGHDLYPGTEEAPNVVELSDESFARFKRLGYVVEHVTPDASASAGSEEAVVHGDPEPVNREPRMKGAKK